MEIISHVSYDHRQLQSRVTSEKRLPVAGDSLALLYVVLRQEEQPLRSDQIVAVSSAGTDFQSFHLHMQNREKTSLNCLKLRLF